MADFCCALFRVQEQFQLLFNGDCIKATQLSAKQSLFVIDAAGVSREMSVNVPTAINDGDTIHIYVRGAVDLYFRVEIVESSNATLAPTTARTSSSLGDGVASRVASRQTMTSNDDAVRAAIDEDERLARQLQAELDEQEVFALLSHF